MKGLIMDYPLTLTHFFERTRKLFHKKTLATRVPGVGLQRYTYADYADAGLPAVRRARRRSGSGRATAWAPSRGTRTGTWRCTSRRR